ncbi:bifunctional demethylmenaquinone methyltransferase/2-methoxy-6-polyprenyl-1,4-benzoquinol methylase UbiE [Alkalilimnicola ehrlichii MLHE-1]|uniref:Ubiquinone/menaquinone biosynthesis C-methyltransferase UbiE n=1 Tax=Alkalilimnicola ehrlichii (strain ATCC BAA-1101 / DSM 17681 / MLHE-1) TaxID=187272 RepID=Q0ACL1_ALKEH|nr:bifunctional demethylmenaquinone methyltransferase/2-methoxy-6-polyprenyl-1,4-benzoquinol methylase UbiE [Alkalilimnicola ehrlichii]ABI55426.1 demethylmenaquinone methyltransferase [Alkalilimnicola ehrlichii MLHE-1]
MNDRSGDTRSKRDGTIDFGYQQVPVQEKARRVGQVFRSVADRYDLMNDLMSAGLHRLWKHQAINRVQPRRGHRILDLAAGTGDLTLALSKRVGPEGQVVMTDINEAMLARGRDRMIDAGRVDNVRYALCNAEALPFPDQYFDRVTIAFGLRNVTHKDTALREMYRVLKPGGWATVLEFSRVYIPPLRPVYDLYSFRVLPLMGRLVANDAESYRYLAESIRMHPPQEQLAAMMAEAGFEDCDYLNLSAGVVAIHRGFRY